MLSAFKNYFIAFLIAAVIFGLIAYFVVGYVFGLVDNIFSGKGNSGDSGYIVEVATEPDETEPPAETTDPTLVVPDGEPFTWLFVGSDYRPDLYSNYYRSSEDVKSLTSKVKEDEDSMGLLKTEVSYIKMTWAVVVHADIDSREFAYIYLSPQTMVSTTAGEHTLAELYGYFGMDKLTEYVSYMTGMQIDNRFLVNGYTADDFAEAMGDLSMDISKDIYYISGTYSTSSEPIEDETEATDEVTAKSDDKKDETKETEAVETKEGDETAEKAVKDGEVALKSGSQSIDKKNIMIINGLRERSYEDIQFKSDLIIGIIKNCFAKFCGYSVEDATAKYNQITGYYTYTYYSQYAETPTLAGDMPKEQIEENFEVFKAQEYFDNITTIFPGKWLDGVYYPDDSKAEELYAKYQTVPVMPVDKTEETTG